MYADADIRDSLIWHYDQISLSPALEKFYPGKPYEPVKGNRHLRLTILPRSTGGFALSVGSNDYGGIVQVSVFWERNVGEIEAVNVAGAVAIHFKFATVIRRPENSVRVKINRPPTVERCIEEPDWLHVPVTIPFRAFAANGG